jgi:predicted kinase
MDKEQKKVLVLCRGVPGAGKSSFAEDMAAGAPVLATDDFFMDEGIYKWDPKQLHRAHRDCEERTEAEMQKETPKIFVCNTFVRASDMNPYLELAEEYGYTTYCVILENRHGHKDVHNVPQDVRLRMSKDLKDNIKLV